jgi:ubiquinone/menaquinone biosynthesis C-methylase UbiE
MTETNPAQESLRQWSAVAPAWETYRARLFENVRSVSEWLVDHVEPRPAQTVLELTAGPRETGFLAAPRLGPNGRLISSDFVPAMVEAAQRGATQRGQRVAMHAHCPVVIVRDDGDDEVAPET